MEHIVAAKSSWRNVCLLGFIAGVMLSILSMKVTILNSCKPRLNLFLTIWDCLFGEYNEMWAFIILHHENMANHSMKFVFICSKWNAMEGIFHILKVVASSRLNCFWLVGCFFQNDSTAQFCELFHIAWNLFGLIKSVTIAFSLFCGAFCFVYS